MRALETAVGAMFAPTRFSLVRISIRDLVADGKSLVRNSGVGGGGDIRILRFLKEAMLKKNRLSGTIPNTPVNIPNKVSHLAAVLRRT